MQGIVFVFVPGKRTTLLLSARDIDSSLSASCSYLFISSVTPLC